MCGPVRGYGETKVPWLLQAAKFSDVQGRANDQ